MVLELLSSNEITWLSQREKNHPSRLRNLEKGQRECVYFFFFLCDRFSQKRYLCVCLGIKQTSIQTLFFNKL